MLSAKLAVFILAAGSMSCSAAPPVVPTVAEPSPIVTAQVVKPKTKAEITADQVREQVYKLAKAAEVEALAKRNAVSADAKAEHDKDVDAYRFKVSRWGDWLEISIARLDGAKLTKFTTSVNLQLVTTIHLEAGHDPDEEGIVRYVVHEVPDKEQNFEMIGGGPCGFDEWYPASKGYHWKVDPWLPTAPIRSMFYEKTKADSGFLGGSEFCGPPPVQLTTEHFPQFAADDEIHFDGIAVLYVPAGLGEGVYRKILAAKDASGQQ